MYHALRRSSFIFPTRLKFPALPAACAERLIASQTFYDIMVVWLMMESWTLRRKVLWTEDSKSFQMVKKRCFCKNDMLGRSFRHHLSLRGLDRGFFARMWFCQFSIFFFSSLILLFNHCLANQHAECSWKTAQKCKYISFLFLNSLLNTWNKLNYLSNNDILSIQNIQKS